MCDLRFFTSRAASITFGVNRSPSQNERKAEMTKEADFDAVVIGAGLTGLYQTYRLREMGYRVLGVEGSDNIGGVWHHNRYPGCRIDSESEVY
jgi:cation diffusion facilitator CzcD-associated flavoprotein CzcO